MQSGLWRGISLADLWFHGLGPFGGRSEMKGGGENSQG